MVEIVLICLQVNRNERIICQSVRILIEFPAVFRPCHKVWVRTKMLHTHSSTPVMSKRAFLSGWVILTLVLNRWTINTPRSLWVWVNVKCMKCCVKNNGSFGTIGGYCQCSIEQRNRTSCFRFPKTVLIELNKAFSMNHFVPLCSSFCRTVHEAPEYDPGSASVNVFVFRHTHTFTFECICAEILFWIWAYTRIQYEIHMSLYTRPLDWNSLKKNNCCINRLNIVVSCRPQVCVEDTVAVMEGLHFCIPPSFHLCWFYPFFLFFSLHFISAFRCSVWLIQGNHIRSHSLPPHNTIARLLPPIIDNNADLEFQQKQMLKSDLNDIITRC